MLKKILKIATVVILGAIGSGFWQEILSPALSKLMLLINKTLVSVLFDYRDSIYQLSSNGFREEHSLFVRGLIYFLVIFAYILSSCYLIKLRKIFYSKANPSTRCIEIFLSKTSLFIFNIFTIAVIITFSCDLIKLNYVNGIITYSKTSMEIVAPFITDADLKKLKSDFYRINNASDFYKFNEKLNEIAVKNEIKLKSISLL